MAAVAKSAWFQIAKSKESLQPIGHGTKLPDLEFRNHRFQSVIFHFKANAFYAEIMARVCNSEFRSGAA